MIILLKKRNYVDLYDDHIMIIASMQWSKKGLSLNV